MSESLFSYASIRGAETTMPLFWLLLAASFFPLRSDCSCRDGCELALASYYVTDKQNATYIASLPYNPDFSKDSIHMNSRISIPFQCDCINGEFLGRSFPYTTVVGDTYERIASEHYHNLTTVELLTQTNVYEVTQIPNNVKVNATVACYCGDADISRDYGLFVTYPLRPGDTLESVAREVGFSDLDMLRRYNPGANFSAGQGILYVPRNDSNGSFRPLKRAHGLSPGAIAGISVAVVASLFICLLMWIYYRVKKRKRGILLSSTAGDNFHANGVGPVSSSNEIYQHPKLEMRSSFSGIQMDKSVEFSYEELASATNDFNMSNKIGEGGFGAVYYAEIRGEKAAIKKMAMQATKEFLAELNVLTHVHHLNLVRLIGYCTDGSLFLVYEYIENGNLSQHLRGSSGKGPLSWSVRTKIGLDSARGLEYIHEHTVPLYIHRDIKSANILIDEKLRAKVADFGLTKFTKPGDASLQSKVVGTFGYMSPEYARYGEVSPKVDVYAFGVVLYELISAKPAIVKTTESGTESRGLVDLFEDVFSQPDPKSDLPRLIDPRLGSDYSLDSVYQMAQLARICTHEEAQRRPDMREVVVALMTLSSSTGGWDVGALVGNPALLNLMSGR
ncbi:unnamed protein product [Spirodela intermedia]|uniref:non-specific serine/threonine protein kinase n=1 Tax=Spirodela intermedia TaxID=51605 RepID=A0A7I8ISE2_SPIIN|nr:unnamed protein product [Spirodela intermedia]CAA6660075.1 unnamed protein product [Spirodela intermedia]